MLSSKGTMDFYSGVPLLFLGGWRGTLQMDNHSCPDPLSLGWTRNGRWAILPYWTQKNAFIPNIRSTCSISEHWSDVQLLR